MVEVLKKIGSDGGPTRDYATITLWEAALGGAAGGGGNDAIGECYDDSAFDESPTIDDGTPDSITLKTASGHENRGIAGTGARIVRTAGSTYLVRSNVEIDIEDLELDANGNSCNNICHINATSDARRVLVHDATSTIGTIYGIHVDAGVGNVINCFVYDIYMNRPGVARDGAGIQDGTAGVIAYYNNTVYNIKADSTGTAKGIYLNNGTVKNCIVVSTGGTGAVTDFDVTGTEDYNADSDGTAGGVNSITTTAANLFESTAGGFEDLHLKVGADAIDEGVDLLQNPAGVEIDIDGLDRHNDPSNDPWDIGAHEFVGVVDTSSS